MPFSLPSSNPLELSTHPVCSILEGRTLAQVEAPQDPDALAWILPNHPRLEGGQRLVFEAMGISGPVEWSLEMTGGDTCLQLERRAEGRVLLCVTPDSHLDTIVFLRATSVRNPRQTALMPVRLLPGEPDLDQAHQMPVRKRRHSRIMRFLDEMLMPLSGAR